MLITMRLEDRGNYVGTFIRGSNSHVEQFESPLIYASGSHFRKRSPQPPDRPFKPASPWLPSLNSPSWARLIPS